MSTEKKQDVIPNSWEFKMTEGEIFFKQLKAIMKKEVEELPNTNSRRGFLQALITGSTILGVIGSANTVSAWGCCEQNNLFCNQCIFCKTGCQVACQSCTAGQMHQQCEVTCYTCQDCQSACENSSASQNPPCPLSQNCGSQQTCIPGFEHIQTGG